MATNQKKLPVVLELERIFLALNRGLFNSELRLPTHVWEPQKKVVFRFQRDSYHIVIGSAFGTERSFLQHYLHEMCHIYNFKRKLADCTSNQYHNKKFLEVALDVGFYVAQHKSQGWSITKFAKPKGFDEVRTPSIEALERRRETVDRLSVDQDLISNGKLEMRNIVEANKPKACFLKYVCSCPPPYNSIRTGRRPDGPNAPQIRCETCGKLFRYDG